MKKTKFALILAALLASAAVATGVSAEPVVISPNPVAAASDTATAQTVKFTDIAEDASYKDAVYKLVNNGVLNGYPDGTFLPEGNPDACRNVQND